MGRGAIIVVGLVFAVVANSARSQTPPPGACRPDPTAKDVKIIRIPSGPDYPPEPAYVRKDETVVLDVVLSRQGAITAVNILRSSGDSRLDDFTSQFIRRNWRWYPPIDPRTCGTTEAHVSIAIEFEART
jgi:TonB family protein